MSGISPLRSDFVLTSVEMTGEPPVGKSATPVLRLLSNKQQRLFFLATIEAVPPLVIASEGEAEAWQSPGRGNTPNYTPTTHKIALEQSA